MGPRNLLILFFSTVAVSLVILIIFFSLFFKNVDLNFNTRLPESAPDIGSMYGNKDLQMDPNSKASGVLRSTVNVPPESQPAAVASSDPNAKKATSETPDADLPPVSDDAVLNNDEQPPVPDSTPAEPLNKASAPEKTAKSDRAPAPAPIRASEKHAEKAPSPDRRAPAPPPAPQLDTEPSGPPVPGQAQ